MKKTNSFLKVITTSIQNLRVKFSASLLIAISILSSCSDPSEVILDPGNNQIGVFYTEIPLSVSMVLLDSFNTTRQGRLVAGGDISPFFGKTESIAYSRLSFNPDGKPPRDSAIFDSAKFNLNIVNLEGTNLSEEKTFRVHRLLEPIQDTTYYNFNQLSFADETIAQGSFLLKADTVNTVSMDLDENLAMDFFNKLKNDDPVFSNIFAFREYFSGITITGNPEEQTTISMAPGSGTGINLYYHYEGDTVSTAYPINTIQSRYFNAVKSDRSGTSTEPIEATSVAYDLPGDLVGSKANLGLVVKIETAPIAEFLDTLENVNFNQVSLEMGPLENFTESKQPIKNIMLYFSDENNGILLRADGKKIPVQAENQAQIQGTDENGNVVPAVDNPNSLVFNGEKFLFTQQITSYINALYREGLPRTDLFLYPTSPNAQGDEFKQSLREFVVNKNALKLKIYYSRVK